MDEAEEELEKHALKTLKKIAELHPTRVCRGLHMLVAPVYGGERVLPAHLRYQGGEDLDEVQLPPPNQVPDNRDPRVVSSRTRFGVREGL